MFDIDDRLLKNPFMVGDDRLALVDNYLFFSLFLFDWYFNYINLPTIFDKKLRNHLGRINPLSAFYKICLCKGYRLNPVKMTIKNPMLPLLSNPLVIIW